MRLSLSSDYTAVPARCILYWHKNSPISPSWRLKKLTVAAWRTFECVLSAHTCVCVCVVCVCVCVCYISKHLDMLNTWGCSNFNNYLTCTVKHRHKQRRVDAFIVSERTTEIFNLSKFSRKKNKKGNEM